MYVYSGPFSNSTSNMSSLRIRFRKISFFIGQRIERRIGASWHSGTIVDVRKNAYQVEHKGFENAEVVPRSIAVTRRVRPLPPPVSFGTRDLYYGLCVDVYNNDAWWEGVIFDKEDGCNERVVFLPFYATKIKVEIKNLRVSQEWDEFNGDWKRIGTWEFIDLFTGDQEWPIDLLAKRTWRIMKERFGDRICAGKRSWKESVDDLVTKELDDKSVLDWTSRKPDAAWMDSQVVLPSEYPLIDHNVMMVDEVTEELDNKPVIDGETMNLDAVLMDSQALLPSEDSSDDGDMVVDNSGAGFTCTGGEGLLSINTNKLDGRQRNTGRKASDKWAPVGHDMLSGAEFCPEAITKYAALGSKRAPESLVIDVRKHLSYLGWKIECMKYRGAYKFKYISPHNGKIYFSLRVLCQDLRDPTMENCYPISQLDALPNDSEESSKRAQQLKRKRKDDDLSQFPCKGDSCGTNDVVGSVDQKYQNASLPKPKRGKTIEGLKKKRDKPKGNQPARMQGSNKRVCREQVSSCPSNPSPRTILSWLIDNNLVSLKAKVHYRSSKAHQELKKGRITRVGIECDCCNKVFTLTGFEAHAGSTNHRPSANIVLEDGRSLLDCQRKMVRNRKTLRIKREAKKKGDQDQHERESDYICSVCHCTGKLILCDRCPSAFHMSCLGLKVVGRGDWFCPSCCCGICGHGKFAENIQQSVDASILSCDQCERKYHVGCLRSRGIAKLERKNSNDNWFCSYMCEDIFLGLQKLLGNPVVVGEDNLTWTLLKPIDSNSCDSEVSTKNHSKLNLALEVMHECFEPVEEAYTGRDIAEDVIFTRESDLHRLNFRGFYTIVLERNEELITVANVRVFGEKVAELPLVATRFQYRRLGMCRILMDELEKQLINLGVQRLMLPAVSSALDTWINAFGFSKLTDCDRMQYLDHTFLDFYGTVMCQKVLERSPSAMTKPG